MKQPKHPQLLLTFSLFGAPLAWMAQVTVSQMFAAYACFPHISPNPWPVWPHLQLLLGAFNAACVLATIASGTVGWIGWRQRDAHAPVEQTEDISKGRGRFLDALALLSSTLFIIASLMTVCAYFLVSPCRNWF